MWTFFSMRCFRNKRSSKKKKLNVIFFINICVFFSRWKVHFCRYDPWGQKIKKAAFYSFVAREDFDYGVRACCKIRPFLFFPSLFLSLSISLWSDLQSFQFKSSTLGQLSGQVVISITMRRDRAVVLHARNKVVGPFKLWFWCGL